MHFILKGRITAGCGRLSGRSGLIARHASAAVARPRFYATSLEAGSKGLIFKSSEAGSPFKAELSKLWLRDNCRCAQCVNQDTLQRNFDTFAIPKDLSPQEISPKNDGVDILCT